MIRDRLLFHFGKWIVKTYCRLMFKLSVVFHLPISPGAKIIVANHPTNTDPFILTSLSKNQARILINGIFFDVPIFGKYLKWSGHIPVRAGQGHAAFNKALSLLKEGITIVIFVEGGLSKFFNKMNDVKTGAVRLALLSQVPIIPAGISVRKENIRMISSVVGGVREWGRWYLNGSYAITVGRPICLQGNISDRSQVRKLSTWLSKKISQLMKESAQRIQ